jgi:uncharacterized protein YjgD (DUF1641 family)
VDDTQTLADLHRKIDVLMDQVQALALQAAQQRQRQQESVELQADLAPILTDAYLATVEQLGEIEPYVRLTDVIRLLKRLARNTRNIEQILDQLESASDLIHDGAPLGKDAVLSLVETLDQFEQRGYFAMLREAGRILDNIVTAFSADDARRLGDNIVTILTTVRELTQPSMGKGVSRMA